MHCIMAAIGLILLLIPFVVRAVGIRDGIVNLRKNGYFDADDRLFLAQIAGMIFLTCA